MSDVNRTLPQFRTILCPTDLSPAADRALAVSYALASPDSVVHLLFVNEPTVVQAYGYRPESPAAVEKRVRGHLSRLVPDTDPVASVRTEVHVTNDPSVAARIVAEAARLKADVIVMGTHGQTGFGRAFLGAVALNIVRTATVPVIFVRDRGRRPIAGE